MKVYNQIKFEERKSLYVMKKNGSSVKEIAEVSGRHRSSIYRELARNKDIQMGYLPDTAQKKAVERKNKQKPKLDKNEQVKQFVMSGLKDRLSPELIAGTMRVNHPPLSISTETIYQYVYSEEGNRLGLYHFLEKGRSKRNKLKGRTPRKSIIPNRTSIHNRPDSGKDEPGHVEIDLTFCNGDQSQNLLVAIEKKSRFIKIARNVSKKALEVGKNMFNTIATFPQGFVKTATFDNGSEFVKHMILKDFFDINTYFCDPHSPWQKPQVENVNRIIHKYIPKNRSLNDFSDQVIQQIEDRINNRPRKCLNFKTPSQVFNEFVALQA